ncbi:MAG TPA: hypothetical protein VFW07_05185 [Parafilimonas sp.]|nr:hypothetical protein [Parafilimonas sp.]
MEINLMKEDQSEYAGFVNKSENEKLRENIFRSPIEKLQLFTKMLRRESIFRNAKLLK